jgi:hypothetical protein
MMIHDDTQYIPVANTFFIFIFISIRANCGAPRAFVSRALFFLLFLHHSNIRTPPPHNDNDTTTTDRGAITTNLKYSQLNIEIDSSMVLLLALLNTQLVQ